MQADWEQAVRGDDVRTLARLLDEGADINARDAHGQTGVMLAVVSAAPQPRRFSPSAARTSITPRSII